MGAPPSDPRVVTPTYCYNYVEFVFGAKCVLLRLKKHNSYTVNVLLLLLPHFCTLLSYSVVFVDGWSKNISCPRAQGTLATPLFNDQAKQIFTGQKHLDYYPTQN